MTKTLIALIATGLLASASAAEPIGQDAALCAAGRGPAFQVDAQGLKDRTGELWLELYPATEADYLRPDQDLVAEGKAFRRTIGRLPAAGPVQICVRAPRPGRYALLLRHNRVGKDKFSFWTDGVGIPANQKLGRRKPTIAQAVVETSAGVTTVPIRLQYLRGFGFAPLS